MIINQFYIHLIFLMTLFYLKISEQQLTPQEIYDKINNIDSSVLQMTPLELNQLLQTIDMQIQNYREEIMILNQEIQDSQQQTQENNSRVESSKQLPMLISTISELLPKFKDEGTGELLDACIIKTTARDEIFCKSLGLLSQDKTIHPNQVVAVNRDTFLLYQSLSSFYDNRVKNMLVEQKPEDTFDELGGIDGIIREIEEAVILPLEKPHLFREIGIKPSKGLILYSKPGLGKTKIARCIANRANSIFISLCATELIQMYIGEGSQLLTNIFKLATDRLNEYDRVREEFTKTQKSEKYTKEQIEQLPTTAIIYIDEIDAIGTRRSDDENKSNKEIGRVLMTLLNLLDGFTADDRVKVVASTNRIDSLDPALIRSNRFDKKIEIPMPNQEGRCQILKIHSKKLNVSKNVNFEEIAKITEEMSGAQLRAVCVEAAMTCIRRKGKQVEMQDYLSAVNQILNINDEDRAKAKNII